MSQSSHGNETNPSGDWVSMHSAPRSDHNPVARRPVGKLGEFLKQSRAQSLNAQHRRAGGAHSSHLSAIVKLSDRPIQGSGFHPKPWHHSRIHRIAQAKEQTNQAQQLDVSGLLAQLASDTSVKTQFKAELARYRQTERQRLAILKDEQQGSHTDELGAETEDAGPADIPPGCKFPEMPYLCKPMYERDFSITQPDIVQATLRATGIKADCGVSKGLALEC